MSVRVRAQPLVVSTFAQVTVAALQLSTAPTVGSQSGMFAGLQPRSSDGGQLVQSDGLAPGV